MLARFPVGTATFRVAVAAYAIELGFWQPDTVLDGLALVPAGAVLLVASGWISEAMAPGSRALTRWGAR